MSVLLGDGDGTFTVALPFAVGDAPRAVAAGDLNGDGLTDLVTANEGSHDVSVLLPEAGRLGSGGAGLTALFAFAARRRRSR